MSVIAEPALYERLVARVVPTDSGCWEWQGCRSEKGYGGIQLNGRKVSTHRAMWQAITGTPAALYVCHRCDNPPCINPEHLFEGSAGDNAQDRQQKGRGARALGELNAASKFSDATVDALVRRLVAGAEMSDIAAETGACIGTLRLWLRKRGVWLGKKGARNGRAKLAPEDVQAIRARLARGETQMGISRIYGVSGPTIARIAHGKGWL